MYKTISLFLLALFAYNHHAFLRKYISNNLNKYLSTHKEFYVSNDKWFRQSILVITDLRYLTLVHLLPTHRTCPVSRS